MACCDRRFTLPLVQSPPPFTFEPLGDGRFELRAFSDDSPDPIVLALDREQGRALGLALAEVLSAMDAPDTTPGPLTVAVGDREVVVSPTPHGVRLVVSR